jgi:hypothetical protein
MATALPIVPNPPNPTVRRFDAQGKPTEAQVTYEQQLLAFLRAVKKAVELL